uniref:kelch-like protein 13 n=1 Tax=Styela clava TaxID=7725 RepID=UPI00193A4225|nr:kelch-like protein 13 [Styela clava]
MDKIENLIFAADLWKLCDLVDTCSEYLLDNLSVENCIQFANLTQAYNQKDSKQDISDFIIRNFKSVIERDEFLTINKKDLCAFISKVSNEVLKWNAATKWVKVEDREKEFVDLLRLIKLEELSNDFIRENVKTEPLMNESMECKDLLIDAMLETRSENLEIQKTFLQEVEESNEIDENEGPQPYFVVLREESRILHKFNCSKKDWSQIVRIPRYVSEQKPDIFSINNTIYLHHGKYLRKLNGKEWINLASMLHEPSYFRCVTFKGFIYVIEGWKTSSYSLEENTWTEDLEGCGLGRGFAVTTSDSYIYAMGGEETSKQAKEFDPNLKIWEPIESMDTSKHFCSATWFDEKIHVLGGYRSLNRYGHIDSWSSSEVYTNSVDSWSSMYEWNLKKTNIKAFIIKQEIYLIGDSNYVTVLFMSGGNYKMKNIDVGGNCSPIACLIYE